MKSFFYLLFLIALFLACNTNQKINSKEKTPEKVGLLIHEFSKTFRGFFTNYKFEKENGSLNLVLKDSILTGDFVFDSDCKGFSLKGKLLPNNKFEINDGDLFFEGEFKDSMHFNGQCTEKKMKQFTFVLEQKDIILFKIETSQSEIQNSEHLVDGNSSRLTTNITTVVNAPTLIENKINQTLLTAALKQRFDLDGKIPKTKKEIQAKLQGQLNIEEGDGFDQEINVSYLKRYDDIACFSVGGNFYAFGTPHPSASLEFFNFKLSNGELIHLSDLLNKGEKGKLNKIAEKILYKNYGKDMWDFENGEFELNDNFEISKKGLTFLFNQYEIGPYAIGMPEIFIPYSKIKKLLKSESVLKEFDIEL